jgi:formylglycine-generating enzyme required for sulfatase activity
VEQDKKQEERRKRKKPSKAPAVSAVEPQSVHCAHKVWLVIRGSRFKRKSPVRLEGKLAEVLETRWDSKSQMRVLIRAADQLLPVPEGQEPRRDIRLFIGQAEKPAVIELMPAPLAGTTVIPSGAFKYGSDEGSQFERPLREMTLPEFACDLREVSNAEYLEFLNYIQEHGDHSKCHPDEGPLKSHIPDWWDSPALRAPGLPVTGVDWYDAYAYAAWKDRRLPIEEEWEKAARGTEGAAFPWGNEANPALANTAGAGTGLALTTSLPAGRSIFGLYHAAGNAWEWTASRGPEADQAVIRGGSWQTDIIGCRAFVRNWLDRRTRRPDLGFRCAADL